MTFQLFYYSQLTFDNSAKPIQREKKSDIGITELTDRVSLEDDGKVLNLW